MSLFPLNRKTVTVRGTELELREWTPAERAEFSRLRGDSPEQAVYFMVATCLVSPKHSIEEVSAWPAVVLDEVIEHVMALNGASEDAAKNG